MDKDQQAQYEARARIIKALAHPSRLFIVEELNRHELCVNEITDMIGVDVSTVSKHLGILKNAGLVTDERRGTCIYYRLRVPCILDFIGCVETVLQANADDQIMVLQSCRKR